MIPQWKKDKCKWCAEGNNEFDTGYHFHGQESKERPCAAPSAEAYIAELEARLKDSADDKARLNWLDQTAVTVYRDRDQATNSLNHIVVVHEDRRGSRRGEVHETVRAAIDAARGAK